MDPDLDFSDETIQPTTLPAGKTPQEYVDETYKNENGRIQVDTSSRSSVAVTGSSLLDGSYDEEESAESFADALRAWRDAKHEKISQSVTSSTQPSSTQPTVPLSLDIKFTKKLSYFDQLMLDQLRQGSQSPNDQEEYRDD